MALDVSGIHNVGEFYSHHYLSAVLDGDLKALFKTFFTTYFLKVLANADHNILSLTAMRANLRVDHVGLKRARFV